MSDILIGAVISLIAVSLVAPFVNHYLTRRREKPAQLEIAISPSSHQTSKFLSGHLQATSPRLGEDEKRRETLGILGRCASYILFTLHNRSNRKLTGVSVRIEDLWLNDCLFQIDDGPDLYGPRESSVSIGDILPHQSRKLHVWSPLNASQSDLVYFEKAFNFSANEMDSRAYSYRMPAYVETYLAAKNRGLPARITAFISNNPWR